MSETNLICYGVRVIIARVFEYEVGDRLKDLTLILLSTEL
jgi:hypothetical protein